MVIFALYVVGFFASFVIITAWFLLDALRSIRDRCSSTESPKDDVEEKKKFYKNGLVDDISQFAPPCFFFSLIWPITLSMYAGISIFTFIRDKIASFVVDSAVESSIKRAVNDSQGYRKLHNLILIKLFCAKSISLGIL